MSHNLLNPGELPETARKEQLGVAYLRTVAAVAGYVCAVPDADYDSIDVKVASRVGRRSQLDFQVKCTSNTALSDNAADFSYPLKLKNYDDLRADTTTPRYLLVLVVPENPADWLRQSERQLRLKRCGYWASLRDAPRSPNKTSVTIRVERANVLTPEALQTLMAGASPR